MIQLDYLKCWSRWVLKERVFWHFHTLESEDLSYMGSKMMYLYFPKCQLFYKVVVTSKVLVSLIEVWSPAHYSFNKHLRNTFWVWVLWPPLLQGQRSDQVCKRDERNGQSLLSCSFPSTWGKTSIYEVAFEQLKAKCSQEQNNSEQA